jgi:hypothetical protein
LLLLSPSPEEEDQGADYDKKADETASYSSSDRSYIRSIVVIFDLNRSRRGARSGRGGKGDYSSNNTAALSDYLYGFRWSRWRSWRVARRLRGWGFGALLRRLASACVSVPMKWSFYNSRERNRTMGGKGFNSNDQRRHKNCRMHNSDCTGRSNT